MPRIEDYAMIGDCQTAALVSRDATIDWLCLPRFDAGACFAALLGDRSNGYWALRPAGNVRRVERRYRPGTLVLETTFETDEGRATVVDCMPRRDGAAPTVLRLVVGERGRVAFRSEIVLRFDYGAIMPWVRRTEHGIHAIAGPDSIDLHTPVPLRGEHFTTVGDLTVASGDRVPFALVWHRSHEPSPPAPDVEASIRDADARWSRWSSRCAYQGPWREAVVRSLVTLKALTDERTGGIVAAPTTSLPERIGGGRNWDYRYCWLRDATFTLYALVQSGYAEEATEWREWLLRAAAGDPSKLQIMYATDGARRLTELDIPWLGGFEGSRPVRIGNGASGQLQLDVYGELMDALHQCYRADLPPEDAAWPMQCVLLEFLESGGWRMPDEGIWEVRGPRRHFTHSKVMAWVAVDRAIKSAYRVHADAPIERWRVLRAEIHAEVLAHGYNADLRSFVQSYGSRHLDASLLLVPLVGFLPPHDPRVRGTLAAIERHLMRDGLVVRYLPDPSIEGQGQEEGEEGAFLPCSFWLCDNLLLDGRPDEARVLFERLLALRNDVGLISEEYDPSARRLLGNFPQAFTHVAIVNSARNLSHEVGPASHRCET